MDNTFNNDQKTKAEQIGQVQHHSQNNHHLQQSPNCSQNLQSRILYQQRDQGQVQQQACNQDETYQQKAIDYLLFQNKVFKLQLMELQEQMKKINDEKKIEENKYDQDIKEVILYMKVYIKNKFDNQKEVSHDQIKRQKKIQKINQNNDQKRNDYSNFQHFLNKQEQHIDEKSIPKSTIQGNEKEDQSKLKKKSSNSEMTLQQQLYFIQKQKSKLLKDLKNEQLTQKQIIIILLLSLMNCQCSYVIIFLIISLTAMLNLYYFFNQKLLKRRNFLIHFILILINIFLILIQKILGIIILWVIKFVKLFIRKIMNNYLMFPTISLIQKSKIMKV